MRIFGESEEIKQLKEMVILQKETNDILTETNDVLIERMNLMKKELNFIQNSMIDMAKITAQHKNVIMFMISQLEFNEKGHKELLKLIKKI